MAMSGVVPVLDVQVADTTGAGDAYLAGAPLRGGGGGCKRRRRCDGMPAAGRGLALRHCCR